MQKDYMAMAQQAQAAPQAQEQPAQGQVGVQEVFQNLKETLVELQLVKANELDNEITELAELIIAGDEAAIEQNKLFQALQAAIQQVEEGIIKEQAEGGPQQAQAEAPATKDFASMMPPAGGGMLGR